MNSNVEEKNSGPGTALADPSTPARKPSTKARVGARKPHVAPAKGTSARKATSGKKPAKGQQTAIKFREGSKAARIIALLARPQGATLADLTKATGWQVHSVRGFLSGTVGK